MPLLKNCNIGTIVLAQHTGLEKLADKTEFLTLKK
jgi:hypothetical protein